MPEKPNYFGINSLLLLALCLSFVTACDFLGKREPEEREEKPPLTKAQQDSIRKVKLAEEMAKYEIYPKITYHHVTIKDWKHLAEVRKPFNTLAKEKVLKTLNREEIRFIRIGETIVVPDSIVEDLKAYSVFPQYYPGAANIKKLIIVSNSYQAYAAYEYGKLIRFVASNTGKEATQTYPGRYALVWKERNHRSSLDSNWVMPFNINFHPQAGNAFHQFVMPGRPVSHSCCRQFMDDAEWLFKWGEGIKFDSNGRQKYMSGTPVIIIDYFDFSRKRGGPWKDVTSNKDTLLELPEDPMAVEEALIPLCQIPVGSRGSLRNFQRYKYAEDTLRAHGVIRPGVRLIVTVNYNDIRRKKAAALEAKKKAEQERLESGKKTNEQESVPPTHSEPNLQDKTPKQNPATMNKPANEASENSKYSKEIEQIEQKLKKSEKKPGTEPPKKEQPIANPNN